MHTDKWKSNWKRPVIKHNEITQWGWMVSYPEKFIFGQYLDIGAFTYINATNGVTVGNNVEIGSHCAIISESSIDEKKGHILIGNNVGIGAHSTVMPNITIGNNTVIGAHSFVTKSLPPDIIAIGVPAKIIDEIIERKCSCGH